MPSLRETQRRIAAALLDGDLRAAARLVRAGPLPAEQRIAVYANNSWMAFRNSLALSFPAVARLGGPDWFKSVARQYRAAHPSRCGNLQHVGALFPPFLAAQLAGTQHAVIADVAALEWAYQEVLIAPEPVPFDVEALASVPAARYPELTFPLAPTCRLVSSPWPILAVWQANRDDTGDGPTIDLDAGGDRLLLQRVGLEVVLRRLDEADSEFLESLAAMQPLDAATERVTASHPRFDVVRVLRHYVHLGALAGAALPTIELPAEEFHAPA